MKLTDIDKTVLLALDKRKNLWRNIDRQFEQRGLKVNRFIVGGGKENIPYNLIDPEKPEGFFWNGYPWPAFCCYLSHRQILEEAIADGTETLLMLEDDVFLTENFDEVIDAVSQESIEYGIGNDWSSWHLGSNRTWGKILPISPHIDQLVEDNYCFHCVVLKRNLFQVLLDCPSIGPMDYIHSKLIQPKYKCFAIWPVVAPQRDCYSYVNGQNEIYSNYFLNKGKIVD